MIKRINSKFIICIRINRLYKNLREVKKAIIFHFMKFFKQNVYLGKQKKKKLTSFGFYLKTKQIIKNFYCNISEKKYRNYVSRYFFSKINFLFKFLRLLKSRMDNILYKACFINCFCTNRQFRNHKLIFLINQQIKTTEVLASKKNVVNRKSRHLLNNLGFHRTFLTTSTNNINTSVENSLILGKIEYLEIIDYYKLVSIPVDVEKVILEYPSGFIFLTKYLQIGKLTIEDFFRERINPRTVVESLMPIPYSDQNLVYLNEQYSLPKLNYLMINFPQIKHYYKKAFSAYEQGFTPETFSISTLRNNVFGTEFYLRELKQGLRDLTTLLINDRSDRKNFCCVKKIHIFSRPLFLQYQSEGFFDVNNSFTAELKKKETNKLMFTKFSYTSSVLPTELLHYLVLDQYIGVFYTEDLIDILYQFFQINSIILPNNQLQSLNLEVFKNLKKNKQKLLEQWSIDYEISTECIIFCFEQGFKGKNLILFAPYIYILKIEANNTFIRNPKISTVLNNLHLELYPFIVSFFYRYCPMIVALNYGLFPFIPHAQHLVAPIGLLDRTELMDSYSVRLQTLQSLNVVDNNGQDLSYLYSVLERMGYPNPKYQKEQNFNSILVVIQKQIQSAMFKALQELFPEIILDHEKKHYDFFYSPREHQQIYIPSHIVHYHLRSLSKNQILLLLSEKVKKLTGYTLTFQLRVFEKVDEIGLKSPII